MSRCSAARSTRSGPTADASCSTAPARAASTCSSSPAARSTARATSTWSASAIRRSPPPLSRLVRLVVSYFVVPKVILFRTEHSKRTLVRRCPTSARRAAATTTFTAPAADRADHQPLPVLVRSRRAALPARKRAPGHTLAEVIVNTGFEFDRPPDVPVTPAPSAETLRLMRQVVAPELAEVYPQFAARVFGVKAAS